jgi:hypothetical protein
LNFTQQKAKQLFTGKSTACQHSTPSGQLPTVLAKSALFKSYRQKEMKINKFPTIADYYFSTCRIDGS